MDFNGATRYQMTHWWHWLTYGQGQPNAVALQALVACIATLAAICAAIFACLAYRAAHAQVAEARRQTRSNKAQLALARRQFAAEEAGLREQAARARGAAWQTYRRQLAEEDEIRPRFKFAVLPSNNEGGIHRLRNVGESAARGLHVLSVASGEVLIESQIPLLRPDQTFDVRCSNSEFEDRGVRLIFRSRFDTRWVVTVFRQGSRLIESIEKREPLIAPPDAE